MGDTNNSNSGGFAKTTDFKFLGVGLAVFILIALMPTPESMIDKAKEIFGDDPSTDVQQKALNIKLIIALLSTCVVFFATEAIPMPYPNHVQDDTQFIPKYSTNDNKSNYLSVAILAQPFQE